ncbi:MAG TPA: hypothetical protein PKD55_23195 [Bellilinea sp.]|nr:hypothetical protein [Bellilinea sp.]
MTGLITKGDKLEYRLMRFLFYQGYFVRRNFLLKTSLEAKLSDATDIDVLGVNYDTQFLEYRVICECKSGGKAHPIGNSLSLKTTSAILEANLAILALNSATWDIKEFGSNINIKVLTQDRLSEIEQELAIDPDAWVASTDFVFYEQKWNEWQRILSGDRIAERLLELLRTEFWLRSPWVLVHRLMAAVNELGKRIVLTRDGSAEQELSVWLLYESVIHFAIASLRVCSKVYYLSRNQREGIIEKHLTWGEDPKRSKESFEAAIKFAAEVAKQPHSTSTPIVAPPEYAESFIDLIARLCSKPQAASPVARTLELALFHFLFRQEPIDETVMTLFLGTDFYAYKIKAAKDIIMFLVNNTSMPRELFAPFLDS